MFFVFEVVSFCTALLLFNKLKKSHFVLFIPFLAVTIIYEYGSFSGWFTINDLNLWSANLFTTFEFLFYMTLFSFGFKEANIRRWIFICGICFLCFFLLNIYTIQKFWNLNTYTIILGSLIIIFWCCFIFFKIISNESEIDLFKFPLFWISTGLIIFYLSQFAFMLYFNYMLKSEDYQYASLFTTISNASNVVLYSCISIALICSKSPIKKL